MQEVLLPPAHRVLLYGSVHELPAGRYADFQHWCVRAAGIGAGAGAIDRHFAQVSQLLAAGRLEEAADALANLHYCFADTLDNFSPEHLAFGCLVAEVDGVAFADTSEPGLARVLAQLSSWGLTQGQVEGLVEDVKKNWRRS